MPVRKPGVGHNRQIAYESNADYRPRAPNGGRGDTFVNFGMGPWRLPKWGNADGGDLRQSTRQGGSGGIDDLGAEIKSRVRHDKRRTARHAMLEGDIRRRQKTVAESPRSAPKQTSSRASRSSSYESGSSHKRTTDISRTVKSRYRNSHCRDVTSCHRQKLRRGTYYPRSLKYGAAATPRTKQKEDMDREAGVLLTAHGENGERGHRPHQAGGADLFRASGLWGVRGATGRGCFRGRFGRSPKKVIILWEGVNLGGGVRCLITNRMAYGLSALKIWAYINGKEDNMTVALADPPRAPMKGRGATFYQTQIWGREGDAPTCLASANVV